ncbi:MAG: dephospho-CoA kinase [Deltaproteobacteria bacterium RIFOXYA12_FULL_58_15]|nr:MAG: dephospho-CoA kinase [Deltaproteobacteria bacterium RIFOXYA12_FULL_58_15]OGR10209.1 MAG: dephospho-CoA kinase [Deltaproteobacteria bacterium RIFOXYB12_FULL_58_9]
MKLIGLTGGIASGKSTVRAMLAELGADVLDADAVYHQLLSPRGGGASPLARQIEAQFPGVLGEDGVINRRALGERVFTDSDERRTLETITHPAVANEVGRQIAALEAAGSQIVVYDVPLLFERGLEVAMDGVIVVWLAPDAQLVRMVQRDGVSIREANQRLASQLPLAEKRNKATWVIDNNNDLDSTRAQVELVWRSITG